MRSNRDERDERKNGKRHEWRPPPVERAPVTVSGTVTANASTTASAPAKLFPVMEGQELDLDIVAVGSRGDGIAKVAGLIIFVAGTERGQKVRAKIRKLSATCAFAEVVKAPEEA